MQEQSDSKQDKIEQHTSERATKSKKKKILIISGIVIIIVALLLFLPSGLPTARTAMEIRCNILTNWYEYVGPYINQNNQKPLSLIEICQAEYRKGQRPFPRVSALVNDRFPYEYRNDWDLVNDPNRFRKEVPYDLFRGSDGWLIRELVPGKLYKKMLMVDQDGKIYELREIPKEKYKTL